MNITVPGLDARFLVQVEPDEMMGAPWDEHDGHGPVTEWTRRSKRPSEMVLCEERGSYRYYDFSAAVALAKRDNWGPPPYEGATKNKTAAHAARLDFDYLKRWADGKWWWIGVIVTNTETGEEDSLWGIESGDDDYLVDVARDLAQGLNK